MTAVNIEPKSINYMKVIPTDNVQIEALKREPSLLDTIYRPSAEVMGTVMDKAVRDKQNVKIGNRL